MSAEETHLAVLGKDASFVALAKFLTEKLRADEGKSLPR
jgi:hypothetical protein